MGIRGELFSTKFTCDGRTYFFNVKENRTGDVFLSIVESKPSEGESFDRRSIVVFGEHMEGFLKAFQSALKFIDKTGVKVEPNPALYGSRDDETDEPHHSGQREFRKPYQSEGSHDSRSSFRERSYPGPRQDRENFHGSFSRPRDSFGAPDKPQRSYGKRSDGEQPSGRKPALRLGTSRDPHAEAKPVKRIVVRRAKKSDPGS